jgi:hypothetical protein
MVASSNQQETVMDTQKFETVALSDDQLDAVSGGDNKTPPPPPAKTPPPDERKQSDALREFERILQEI